MNIHNLLSEKQNKKRRIDAEKAWDSCATRRSVSQSNTDTYNIAHDNFIDAFMSQYTLDLKTLVTADEKKLYKTYLESTNTIDKDGSNDLLFKMKEWIKIYRRTGYSSATFFRPIPESLLSNAFDKEKSR